MTYAWRSPDGETLIEIVGGNVELPDRTVSAAWVEGLEPEERAELGFEEIVETDAPTDPALNVLGRSVADVEGVATYVWATEPKTLEQVRAERRALVEVQYGARMFAGFPVPSYPGETLQMRSAEDNSRWLALKDTCDEKVEASEGDQPMARPPRSTSNVNLAMTYAEGQALLQAMRDWAGDLLDHRWALKDAIDAAETVEAALAIDVTAGWPE